MKTAPAVSSVALLLLLALLPCPAAAAGIDPTPLLPALLPDNGALLPADNGALRRKTAPAAVPPAGGTDNAAPAVSPPGEGGAEAPPSPGAEEEGPPLPEEPAAPAIADPLEPVNRAFFHFNDKLYFWVLKPVSRGYGAVVPQVIRVGIRNVFSNVAMPIRLVNSLLQGKFRAAGTELSRFAINSTIGMAGFFDPAKTGFHIEPTSEDLGQTLGVYGLGHGVYLVLPVLGPSSLRDAAGLAGDLFLDPLTYVLDGTTRLELRAGQTINNTSLRIGEYESLKGMAVDPYAALRDAYVQHRKDAVGK